MKILLVSSEVVPFAKTGGLADVAGALPMELARMGHDVRVAMPGYASIDLDRFAAETFGHRMDVEVGGIRYPAQFVQTAFPGTELPVYLAQSAQFFAREGLYQSGGKDFPDNALRFAFFSKAVLGLIKVLGWIPDVIHCNDWQTALIPVYLRTVSDMRTDPALSRIRILYTIHNMAYQGLFQAPTAGQIGIGSSLFHPAGLEFYGNLNLMKGGIIFADAITTVSPRYAMEIQTPEFGCGLEGVLHERASDLFGILNGIDYSIWNPATDPLIPAHYSSDDLAGKTVCKAALQKECGLPQRKKTPLIGIISRLDPQKGFDLVAEVLDDLLDGDVQLVLLGTGMPEYHAIFEEAAGRHPGKASIHLKFDNGLAHRIEAGADMFLMPSRYEPCGLNQLYSLKYGTLPIVRETGGLADSIVDATPEAVKGGKATGFAFGPYTTEPMLATIQRALAAYRRPSAWKSLVRNAMAQDFSWLASARKYEALYKKITQ